MGSPRLHMLDGLGVTTVAMAASGSTTLAFTVVAARVLQPQEFAGLARTFALGMAIAQITMAGLAPALARRVGQAPTGPLRLRTANSAIRILVIGSATASLLYLPLARAGLAPWEPVLLATGWSLALVYALYFGFKMLLFSLGRQRLYALLEGGADVLFFGLLFFCAVYAPKASLLGFVVSYGALVLAARALLCRAQPAAGPGRITVDRSLLRYGALAFVATYSSAARIPIAVAVTGFVGAPRDAALVAVMFTLTMPLSLVPQTAGMLTFAGVSRREADAQAVRYASRIAATTSAFAVLALAALAPPILELVFGSNYEPLAPALILLAICLVPQLAAVPIGNALAAEGKVGITSTISLAGLFVACLGTAIAVPSMHALGAAVAFGASAALVGGLLLLIARTRYGLSGRDVLAPVCLSVVAGAASLMGGPQATAVALAGLISVAGILAYRSVQRRTPSEST